MTTTPWQPVTLTAALLAAICLPMAAQASNLSLLIAGPLASKGQSTPTSSLTYPIADTNQSTCYNDMPMTTCPAANTDFYGQDAQYNGNTPSYADNNGDGTVTDNVTGLMWQQDPGTAKKTYDEAVAGASSCNTGGYTDWRLPTIKELYSLILFSGVDASSYEGTDTSVLTPFIDTNYFTFSYGNPTTERIIDAQYLSSTSVVSLINVTESGVFGVNFADGRIKGYKKDNNTFFVRYVRGNTSYGTNSFTNNGDSTITDSATGLQWMKIDSGDASLSSQVSGYTKTDGSLNWKEALDFCENLTFASHTDWRLPNTKELESIVDYSKSPTTTNSAAIDTDYFESTSITDEAGNEDWPYYWTSTTHAACTTDPTEVKGGWAAYVAFGRSLGYMNSTWVDVHGAGAQKSDPKGGNPSDYPTGHGPQNDAVRIYNYVRCVRDADV